MRRLQKNKKKRQDVRASEAGPRNKGEKKRREEEEERCVHTRARAERAVEWFRGG